MPQADLNEVARGHGHLGRDILWSSVSQLQRDVPSTGSYQGRCKRLIAKGIGTSSIAPDRPLPSSRPYRKCRGPNLIPSSRELSSVALPIGR